MAPAQRVSAGTPAAYSWIALLDLGPVAGASVMGTGIVSIALGLTGHRGLSTVALDLTGVVWLALVGVVALRLWREPRAVREDARSPVALTAVAATCVLGTRLTLGGRVAAGTVLLVVGGVLW